jgi:hypothetical protein
MLEISEDEYCNRCGEYRLAGEKHKCLKLVYTTKELFKRGRPKKNHNRGS